MSIQYSLTKVATKTVRINGVDLSSDVITINKKTGGLYISVTQALPGGMVNFMVPQWTLLTNILNGNTGEAFVDTVELDAWEVELRREEEYKLLWFTEKIPADTALFSDGLVDVPTENIGDVLFLNNGGTIPGWRLQGITRGADPLYPTRWDFTGWEGGDPSGTLLKDTMFSFQYEA